MNLIPETPGGGCNYWCTWSAQHPHWAVTTDEAWTKFDLYDAEAGGHGQAGITQKNLLEDPAWAAEFYPEVRGDLLLVIDDGWDVPLDPRPQRWQYASLVLNEQRFPDFDGQPVDRLSALNDRVRDLGWRGLGLWVACQCQGQGRPGATSPTPVEARDYWRQRAQWCKQAGINYWKVDWGHHDHDADFRRMLTDVARETAPDLLVEHGFCQGPLNDYGQTERFETWAGVFEPSLEMLAFSDVWRTYDDMAPLRTPVTLDRVSAWLARGQMEPQAAGIISCEDNVYLAAGLGMAFGTMRVPIRCPYTNWQWERIDEVVRATRWQRIAPAFGIAQTPCEISPTVLTDECFVDRRHWYEAVSFKTVRQHAPQTVSRGLPLPEVTTEGSTRPYVTASRHPDGPYTIATLPRCIENEPVIPRVDVSIEIADASQPVGVFGRYANLTLNLPEPLAGRRVWAQDLKADTATDITARVRVAGSSVTLPGELIETIGLSATRANDPSDPGLVINMLRQS